MLVLVDVMRISDQPSQRNTHLFACERRARMALAARSIELPRRDVREMNARLFFALNRPVAIMDLRGRADECFAGRKYKGSSEQEGGDHARRIAAHLLRSQA